MRKTNFNTLFNPKSVAIVGASQNPASFGYYYMKHLIDNGYRGIIYPIKPGAVDVMGIKAYGSLDYIPNNIEYVICCIALSNVPKLLNQCHRKGVKVVHILSGRGAETGRTEAKLLDEEILRIATKLGFSLLGPNCLGIYCPRSGLSFGYDFPKEPGHIGALIQSGGNSIALIRIGSQRGLRFSKVVSYGNALDINQNDLLEYFTQDPDTNLILCYIEGLKGDTTKFLKILRDATKKKPVIICKAGRTNAGARQTLSHTASMAGSGTIFKVAVKQAGAILVANLDEIINQAVAFSFLVPIKGKRVGLGGGGGGRAVLNSDEWEEHGFEVPVLPLEIREEWKRRGSIIWDWVANPADSSIRINGDPYTIPKALELMIEHPLFDFVAATVTIDQPFEKDLFIEDLNGQIEEFIKLKKRANKGFIVIFEGNNLGIVEMDHWRWRALAQARSKLIEEKVPFFSTVDGAAKAILELINYYQRYS